MNEGLASIRVNKKLLGLIAKGQEVAGAALIAAAPAVALTAAVPPEQFAGATGLAAEAQCGARPIQETQEGGSGNVCAGENI